MDLRLLAGPPAAAGTESFGDHRARLGGRPDGPSARDTIPALEASGLLGRGGAGFPVGRKWRSVAEQAARAGAGRSSSSTAPRASRSARRTGRCSAFGRTSSSTGR